MRVSPALADVLRHLLAVDTGTFGWEIMKVTGRPVGTIYPILSRLTEQGWITWKWEAGKRPSNKRPRKCYELTELGRTGARKALNLPHQSPPPQPGAS